MFRLGAIEDHRCEPRLNPSPRQVVTTKRALEDHGCEPLLNPSPRHVVAVLAVLAVMAIQGVAVLAVLAVMAIQGDQHRPQWGMCTCSSLHCSKKAPVVVSAPWSEDGICSQHGNKLDPA